MMKSALCSIKRDVRIQHIYTYKYIYNINVYIYICMCIYIYMCGMKRDVHSKQRALCTMICIYIYKYMYILYTFCMKETCLLRKEPYTHRKRIRGVTEGVDLVNIKDLTVSRDFFNGLHFFRRYY